MPSRNCLSLFLFFGLAACTAANPIILTPTPAFPQTSRVMPTDTAFPTLTVPSTPPALATATSAPTASLVPTIIPTSTVTPAPTPTLTPIPISGGELGGIQVGNHSGRLPGPAWLFHPTGYG